MPVPFVACVASVAAVALTDADTVSTATRDTRPVSLRLPERVRLPKFMLGGACPRDWRCSCIVAELRAPCVLDLIAATGDAAMPIDDRRLRNRGRSEEGDDERAGRTLFEDAEAMRTGSVTSASVLSAGRGVVGS